MLFIADIFQHQTHSHCASIPCYIMETNSQRWLCQCSSSTSILEASTYFFFFFIPLITISKTPTIALPPSPYSNLYASQDAPPTTCCTHHLLIATFINICVLMCIYFIEETKQEKKRTYPRGDRAQRWKSGEVWWACLEKLRLICSTQFRQELVQMVDFKLL